MSDDDKTIYRRLLRAIAGDPWKFRAVRECGECGGSGKRFLEHGEIILEGDEVEVGHPWHGPAEWKAATCIGEPAPDPKYPAHRIYRRDCPDCKGTGTVFREWVTCRVCRGTGLSEPAEIGQCPNCKGEGRIPDEAGRAVIGWWDNRHKSGVEYHKIIRPLMNDMSPLLAYKWSSAPWTRSHRSQIQWAWDNRHGKAWEQSINDYVRNYEADPEDLLANDGAALKAALREAEAVDDVKITLSRFGCASTIWIYDDTRNRPFNAQADTEAGALLAAAEAAFIEKGGE